MSDVILRNAVIASTQLDCGDRGFLSGWLNLEWDGGGQSFGGFALYLPDGFAHWDTQENCAGHFIFRCLQIAGVDEWSKLKGRSIRIEHTSVRITGIAHIIKPDWFYPERDFARFIDARRRAFFGLGVQP